LSLEQLITGAWTRNSRWLVLLLPFTWLFAGLSNLRRCYLQRRYQGQPYTAPVVIVGNISVGGSGKTPLIIALVAALKQRGYSPGVVSRGYSGNAAQYPLSVTAATAVSESGDEPLLIATLADCPVVVDANRRAAVDYLLDHHQCNLVLSDDGLQHYALHRDIELVVVDGQRGLGNGRQLPSGPLREKPQRLEQADMVVINGQQADQSITVSGLQQMSIRPTQFRHLESGRRLAIEDWLESEPGTNREVHAVAAIGNPQRFADTLTQIGLAPILHRFDDHQILSLDDLSFGDNLPVVVTAKDAIKLEQVAAVSENIWAVDIEAVIDSSFVDKLVVKLEALKTPS
jgi:tetraacyldisaccharide 4'-kinase